MSELPKGLKKRSENWAHEQLQVLVQAYNENKETLDGKFSQGIIFYCYYFISSLINLNLNI